MTEIRNSLFRPIRFHGERRKDGAFAVRTRDMKRRWIVLALAVLAMALLVGTAAAEFDPLKVAMELSSNKFTEPRTISVSIQISNSGEDDMPGPVVLLYPDGKKVEEFGEPVLSVGASQSWTGKWKVTQKQLEDGRLTFSALYTILDDEGNPVQKRKNFSKRLIYESPITAVEVNRAITPTVAGKGQEVTITYDVVNTGTADITDVRITENKSISTTTGKIASIAAGQKGTYTFKVKMGTKDLTSSGSVSYKVDGKTSSIQQENATIRYGEIQLSASLSADKKGGLVGDTVKLSLVLKNTGKEDFEDVTVTDPTLGEVFNGISVAVGESVTLEKELTIDENHEYQFAVSAKSTSGVDVETATDTLKVTAIDPAEVLDLSVRAEADRDTVYELPGTVRFTVYVTNNSAAEWKDVAVTATGVQIYSFPSILAGETREFTREIDVSMAGTYQFVARAKNQLGETTNFESNTIYIRYARPTSAPTEAPIITPPAPNYEPIPQTDDLPESYGETAKTLRTVGLGLLVPVAIGLLLLLIGIIGRSKRAVESHAAMDHLERSYARDYESPTSGADSTFVDAKPGETPPAEESDSEGTSRRRRHIAGDDETKA